ncbi:MAG: HDIG domain-containing protein, partial [Oscillochloris sp.]|nr:HDIG domain-containing protein [Oscillochloris sp.]
QDGRIHPGRIEEVVAKAQAEVDAVIRQAGESAAYEVGIPGLPAEILNLLGRLRYRTSYGQNVLQHSLECALLAAHMAAEIGANINIAKTAALLHDIGKAVDHEVQGPHALIGADIARRLGRSPAIVHAIAAHHHDEEPQTVEAFLVIAADAISGGRPGARRETLDLYIKRLEALETVATSFPGVQRAFAVQAGREVRVMVQPEQIDDLASIHLARDVAKKIEESLQYPGQIKVTIIRETRAIDFAR